MEIYWEISDPTIFTESRNFMEVFLTLFDGSNCSMGFRFVCDLIYLSLLDSNNGESENFQKCREPGRHVCCCWCCNFLPSILLNKKYFLVLWILKLGQKKNAWFWQFNVKSFLHGQNIKGFGVKCAGYILAACQERQRKIFIYLYHRLWNPRDLIGFWF